MKLATGTELFCPKCGGALCRPILRDDEHDRPRYIQTGHAIAAFEFVLEYEEAYNLFFAECKCGLCMFCQWTPDGWEYRVMV